MSLRCTLLAAFVLAPALAPVPAAAQVGERPRTVVLRFEGWRAEAARRAVLEALQDEYELVAEDTLVDTAARIGVDVSTPEGMAAVVEHLGVALVVGGFVEGTGRSATSTVWVMDVRGNELARRTASGSGGRRASTAIGAAAREACAEAMAVLRRPPPEPEPPPETSPAQTASRDDERPRDEALDVSGRWNQPLVRALAGLRIRNRAIALSHDPNNVRFDADFFPEIEILAEARPFARAPGAERGLYVAIAAGFSVGMTYAQQDGDVETMQTFHVALDAGYGLVLAEMAELVLSVGWGIDGFDLQGQASPSDFPSVAYHHLRPALQGRVRLVPQHLLALEAGLGGRIAMDLGQIQGPGALRDRAGRASTGASGGGLDLFVGFAGSVDGLGFSWALRLAYTSYWLGVDGLSAASTAQDEAVQFWLLVGWAF